MRCAALLFPTSAILHNVFISRNMNIGKLSAIAVILAASVQISSAQRISRTINESWNFHKDGETSDILVNIPHTWNAEDSRDEIPGYFRGKGFYSKTLTINEEISGNSFFLNFEGAYQTTDVYVNGRHAGTHYGGYTAFCFDISEYLEQGENLLEITVDNSLDENIPPLTADFTFFGGIYRDLTLIITPKLHISTTHYATSGVYISTSDEDSSTAVANVRTFLSNDGDSDCTAILTHKIIAPDGAIAAEAVKKIKLKAGTENYCDSEELEIENPVLWGLENPELYEIVTTVSAKGSDGKDMVSNSFGIRWFEFDPEEGFSINGEYRKLMGTNRHQSYWLKGDALQDEMHVRDIRLLKDMGGNFLRISHYPQDPVISQMCDRYGIVTSVEIPVVNEITMSEKFRHNCVEMAREMVWQDFNSPSVVMWAYMNEVLLHVVYDRNDPAEKKAYQEYLVSIAQDIDNAIKEIDPDRYTMLPCHNKPEMYKECGLSDIPDILGWNVYAGWYIGGLETFRENLDRLHAMFPDQSLLITEYGADADPRLHSFDSRRFDFTCEYALKYHHHYIPEILGAKWLAGTNIWNLNDFYSEKRMNAVPHINSKGITGIDRERKDSYYLYKAWLNDEPMIRIEGHNWKTRGGTGDEAGVCTQPVEVYTNAASVELFHNGISLGEKAAEGKTAVFDVPFIDGENSLEATAGKDGKILKDFYTVDFRMVPYDLSDRENRFIEMNVMLGTNRYFDDRTAEIVWIPEQKYRPGSWGYTGGEPYEAMTKRGHIPGTDIDIMNTEQDPIFQTQRKNIKSFRADVPDGEYYVYLYFSELVSEHKTIELAYLLGNNKIEETRGERVFDVSINGMTVLKDFDIAKECGEGTAVIKKFTVDSYDESGIDIRFIPKKGEPVLNAVRIYKCF